MLRKTAFALLVLLAVLVVWHPARVAVQTLLLLPSMFPSAPFDPLAALTPTPVRSEHTFDYSVGTIDAEIFHPAWSGPHSAVLLMLGIGDLPMAGLAEHFAEGLARLGIVVMLPQQSGLLAQNLDLDEVDGIRASFEVLASQPDVDPERIGAVSLSAAGGLSIVAAALPELRDRMLFINSFGSYFDGERLLLDTASRSIDVAGQILPWPPEQRTIDVITMALRDAGVDEATLQEIESGTTRERATELIAGLPPVAHQSLDEISPSTYLQGLRTPLYLMHDEGDTFVPFTESRHLVAAAPEDLVERYTEFSIFSHVIPDKPVPWQTFVADVWRLFWHVHAVLLELI
jgi:hypothetical protein